ncbi:hypothetical protein P3L10_002657 [Capsicum annuum]
MLHLQIVLTHIINGTMVAKINFLFCFLSLVLLFSSSTAKTPPRPRAFLLSVTKDAATKQYLTSLPQRTPLVPEKLTIDLGQRFLWVDCEKGYVSSTYKPVPCGSVTCKRSLSGGCVETCLAPPSPGCNNNTCSHSPYNPFIRTSTSGELAQDVISIQSTDGSNPGSYFQGEPSTDYFIGVTSIKINGNVVPINTTLLNITKDGNGGTKISTVDPYTKLETSIYSALTMAFIKSLAKIPRVKPVAPFKVCYNRTSLGSTRVGPGVPPIELVLGTKNTTTSWNIWGANSMVAVNNEVLCLGFVDGGVEPTTSIIIGAHQIEENLLQFDIANKRLGFTSSLLFGQTTCANFNFKSKA